MGGAKAAVVVVLVVAMVTAWGVNGQICNIQQKDLSQCKPAVAMSNPTVPTAKCCGVVQSLTPDQVQCLCNYGNNQPTLLKFASIDPDRAMQLPGLCKGTSERFSCS